MEPDVRGTLSALYQERAGVSAQEAEAWQADLRDKQRYLADVWAKG
jgi:sulfite reductase alpha subunit-like flavoprotein